MLSKVNYKIYHDEQQNVKLSTPLSPPPKKKQENRYRVDRIIFLVTPFHWIVYYPEALPSVVDTKVPCRPTIYGRFDILYHKPVW